MKRTFEIILILAAVFLIRCEDDGDNYIKGSLAENYDMSFDEARVRLYPSELSVEYVVDSEQGEKVALRVTLRVSGSTLSPGETYDLVKQGTIGRGQGFGSPLPAMESGEIELEEYSSEQGSCVKGSFEALFIASDKSRQSLRGGFSADLEVVE